MVEGLNVNRVFLTFTFFQEKIVLCEPKYKKELLEYKYSQIPIIYRLLKTIKGLYFLVCFDRNIKKILERVSSKENEMFTSLKCKIIVYCNALQCQITLSQKPCTLCQFDVRLVVSV